MASVELIPVIGAISYVRAESLRGCHALTDHAKFSHFPTGRLGETVETLTKQLLAHDEVLLMRLKA